MFFRLTDESIGELSSRCRFFSLISFQREILDIRIFLFTKFLFNYDYFVH